MRTGAITLSRYPGPMVIVKCEICDREGRYSKARLIEEYGPDYRLPDLQAKLTGCKPDRTGCKAFFPDLRRR